MNVHATGEPITSAAPDARESGPSNLLAWLLLVLFALAWFGTLDNRRLIKPDEGRYAEIAREMAESKEFVTPRLNGIKYFYKPPLQYWATATAFLAFGENEWTARLWCALTGFLAVLAVAFTATRLFGKQAAWYAGLVLASSLWWVLMGHLNTLDMAFAAFLGASLCGFLLGQSAAPGSLGERNAMLAAWGAAALAVLSKGLAGLVLPGMVLVIYCMVQRDLAPLKRLHAVKGLLLLFAICAPWFFWVQADNPEFAWFFFIHEHFHRYVADEHRRTQAIWYFVPILALALLPWTGMVFHAAAKVWRTRAETQSVSTFNAHRFLLLWSLMIFAFFSASSSKLPSYILPILPALALLTGDWLTRATPRALLWHLGVMAVLAVAAAAILPTLSVKSGGEAPNEMLLAYSRWLIAAAALLAAGLAIATLLLKRRGAGAALICAATASLAAWLIALSGHETLGRSNSAYYIAEEIKPLLRPGVPFYSVGTYEQTLPFYLKRTVTLVDYRDEFSFGLEQEPGRAIPDLATFKQRWENDTEAFAMVTPDGYKLLGQHAFPMKIVARDPRRIVIGKP